MGRDRRKVCMTDTTRYNARPLCKRTKLHINEKKKCHSLSHDDN